jgi:hypothetical protein
LLHPPAGLRYVWLGLVVLTILEAMFELGWIGGPSSLYRLWIHDLVLGAAAALILARAAYEPVARRAWLAFGLAMAAWCLGTAAWSVAYGDQLQPPYPTFADILWLAWYPLVAVGILFLIRVRFQSFELPRWLDGVAVTLIVLVAGFALVIQPVADESHQGRLATVVDFTYPVLDLLLIGAVLGIYGLLGWRPDAMWLVLGFGILATTIADAAFAVQEAHGVAESGRFDYVWTIGALLMAYAAWVPPPDAHAGHGPVTGMRAVLLALIAQALAIGIQIYAFFEEIGRSERIVTALVLVVASVQIVLTRPKPETAPAASDRAHDVAGSTRVGPEPDPTP